MLGHPENPVIPAQAGIQAPAAAGVLAQRSDGVTFRQVTLRHSGAF